jgi:hypothetical protein
MICYLSKMNQNWMKRLDIRDQLFRLPAKSMPNGFELSQKHLVKRSDKTKIFCETQTYFV